MKTVRGKSVLVTGGGVSGFAAADALVERGARVVLVDGATSASEVLRRVEEALGAP